MEKKTVEIGDDVRHLEVIEVKTKCCDPVQESVDLYFEVDGHMFVGSVYYWHGDPNAERFRDSLKKIVLSLKILPESRRN